MLKKLMLVFNLNLLLGTALLASPRVGDIAPDIQLPYIDGSYGSIIKTYPGETHTIIKFSAYTCKWCRLGMSNLNDLAQRLSGKARVQLITPDSKQKSIKFLEELGINLPTAYDIDFIAFDAYGVTLTPHTFVIDQNKRIIYVHQDKELTREIADHIYNMVIRG
ncbi:MAG: TlpA family protein disulfide reductase [Oligoflexales bacterium]|nr:TlpA family protein disulfide reductase [Oligoflexales bacterium]